MAETPKSCESGPSEGAVGNQHSMLTCKLRQALKRQFQEDSHFEEEAPFQEDSHFKEEPDQNTQLCQALAVKLKLEGDIKREPMVKDPKREENTLTLKQLPKKQGKPLRHSVYKSHDSELATESLRSPWSLYYDDGYLCLARSQPQPRSGYRSLSGSLRHRVSLVFYQHKILNGDHHEQKPKESSEKDDPELPEVLKALEKLKLSSEYQSIQSRSRYF